MKQFLLLASLVLCSLGLSAQTTVFVDADATGTGDGTSWADAYTNLNDALLAAPAGASVWVADGTYTTPDSVSFFIDKELTLLGGFNGTEANAADADPATNATILSGDVMGNDGMTYDSLLAVDNNRVLYVLDTSSTTSLFTVTIDGLTITNGAVATDQPVTDPPTSILPFTGGGIRSYARLNLSRVTFSRNRANFGSDLGMVFSTAGGSVIDNITLSDTYVDENGSLYFNSVPDITLRNNTFDTDDVRTSGIVEAAFSDGFVVEDCKFSNLTTTRDFTGAGLRFANCDDVTVRRSTFEDLAGYDGAAIYAIQSDDFAVAERTEDDFVIDSVTVSDCVVANRGGAFAFRNNNLKITNSTLEDNVASNIGGTIYQVTVDGREYQHVIENTTIRDSEDAGAGGAVCLLVITPGQGGGPSFVAGRVVNSEFEDNITAGGAGAGGAFYLQGDHVFDFSGTTFTGNEAGTGSVIQTQTAGGQAKVNNRVSLTNCELTDNGNITTAFRGGAITMFVDDGAGGLIIDSTVISNNVITNNSASFSGGGAILFVGGEAEAIPLHITNSRIENNASNDGVSGGFLYSAFGMDFNADNTDFLTNNAGGSGGVMVAQNGIRSRDTSDMGDITTLLFPITIDIENSTFITNSAGGQGGAINTFTAGANLTNCVFADNSAATGGGGAIILNGNSPDTDFATGDQNLGEDGLPTRIGEFDIDALWVHNTFVNNRTDNDDAFGETAAFFQPDNVNSADSTSSMNITLLNNAFLSGTGEASLEFEPGADDASQGLIPFGDLNIISLGGNFFNSENGALAQEDIDDADVDVIDEDITDVEDLFVDLNDEDGDGVNVDLAIPSDLADNPLINNGVQNALVPETDIRGNPRGDRPDIGAYEADQGAVSVADPLAGSGLQLDIFPNPTANVVNIRNNEAAISHFNVVVTDLQGRVMTAKAFNGTNNVLDLSGLSNGVYSLQLVVDGKVYSQQVVKQ